MDTFFYGALLKSAGWTEKRSGTKKIEDDSPFGWYLARGALGK
jgi:hypothetical protein